MKLASSLKIKIAIFVINGTFPLQRPDLSHRAFSLLYLWAGYRRVVLGTTISSNWCTRPKRAKPSKWTTLNIPVDPNKQVPFCWISNGIFWKYFGLNRKHLVSPYKNQLQYHVLLVGNLPRCYSYDIIIQQESYNTTHVTYFKNYEAGWTRGRPV